MGAAFADSARVRPRVALAAKAALRVWTSRDNYPTRERSQERTHSRTHGAVTGPVTLTRRGDVESRRPFIAAMSTEPDGGAEAIGRDGAYGRRRSRRRV